MKQHTITWAALIIAVCAAFYAGRTSAAPNLDAQDPGAGRPVLPPVNHPGVQPGANQPGMLVYGEENGTGVSANGILAVTGSYGVGTSVLYVIDTNTKQLSVYEARGGSRGSRRITHVGARRIDLDLQLRSYNDESEYQYDDLERLFDVRDRRAGRAENADRTDASAEKR